MRGTQGSSLFQVHLEISILNFWQRETADYKPEIQKYIIKQLTGHVNNIINHQNYIQNGQIVRLQESDVQILKINTKPFKLESSVNNVTSLDYSFKQIKNHSGRRRRPLLDHELEAEKTPPFPHRGSG